MRLGARNVLAGTVVSVTPGAVTNHLEIDVGGATVAASITDEAAVELGLEAGVAACAVIEASEVTIGRGRRAWRPRPPCVPAR